MSQIIIETDLKQFYGRLYSDGVLVHETRDCATSDEVRRELEAFLHDLDALRAELGITCS